MGVSPDTNRQRAGKNHVRRKPPRDVVHGWLTLILDAEALNALARARERGTLAQRARALELGPAVIATGDPGDLRRLAAASPNLRIVGI
jgi:NAD(P)H-hydrate repair Nnr-like enzyme with NAD(P)H-hydrate dehydratase domain